MKAGQWDPAQKKVVINDIPIPTPNPNQFLVKIQSASLCHSDLHMDMRPDYPATLGHEGVGYIESIGSNAEGKGFKVGDAIGTNYFIDCCFECEGCKLEMAKKVGADAVFNSMTNKNYVEDVKKVTDGRGCHAAAVYSASNAAYAGAPDILRVGGLLMVIGIAPKPLDFITTFDLTTGRYRIKADSTSIPQRMKKAVDFTAKHNIQPDVEFNKIEDLPRMVEDMEKGKADKRQVVVFS
ncbi:hypothetical protein GRF29_8g1172329 [Pseudopithomyces chartarum]|uniref:Alcohol dehydrogenase-like N-terminal domain-containing protein n=1 Tax=Pseudopithomyces chartarum TaxID=1892770 RepID=A0AAN6M7M4_9PLEO|nr:hypothetical protein GRF29_8g1172329 [Pseudopithomyces chartarum]